MAKTKRLNPDNKKTKYKASPMSRTSGVVKRKSANTMSESERIGRQRANEVASPLVRDKNDTGIDMSQVAYDWLGVGRNKGKFSVDPLNLALTFLPGGKVGTAAKALRGAGKVGRATQLEARIASKVAGKEYGKTVAYLRKFGNESGIGQLRSPGERVGSKAYPKSHGQFGRLSPVSDLATNKTPSAGTFRIGPKVSGYKVVDNRYRFDKLLDPKNYKARAAKIRSDKKVAK
jgi:hypothetical protein